jgi:hypothetical protein
VAAAAASARGESEGTAGGADELIRSCCAVPCLLAVAALASLARWPACMHAQRQRPPFLCQHHCNTTVPDTVSTPCTGGDRAAAPLEPFSYAATTLRQQLVSQQSRSSAEKAHVGGHIGQA